MAKKRFEGLTPRQEYVLGCIAMNEDRGHHPATLKALRTKGLIETYKEELDGYPPVRVERYYLPLPVHIRWCEFCAGEC